MEPRQDNCPSLRLDSSVNEVEASRAYLKLCDENIHTLMRQNFSPLKIHHVRARQFDELVAFLFNRFAQGRKMDLSLIATGGYGRSEMSLLSDLDLLFLFRAGSPQAYKELAEKILYVLWDLGLEVGHALRSLADCKRLIGEDNTILTSLLDARFIVGEGAIFNEFVKIFRRVTQRPRVRHGYFKFKVNERRERLMKYGSSVFVLEPHIKEGEGGMRDLHLIRWLAKIFALGKDYSDLKDKGIITAETCEQLVSALNFYLNLRNRIHSDLMRKSDQLGFALQTQLATSLGFTDDSMSLGVEKFMRTYYTVADHVNNAVSVVTQKIEQAQRNPIKKIFVRFTSRRLDENFKIVDKKIMLRHADVFTKDPHNLLKLFFYVQQTGLAVHFLTQNLITANLLLVDDGFRAQTRNTELFRAMMGNLKNLGAMLFAMHEVHFFDALIPEFHKIRNRVQHDIYHVYTVDTHSLFAVSELSLLVSDETYAKKFPLYRGAIDAIPRHDLLSLGLLFHDIGKGEGGNHSLKGAKMARTIATRLGYSEPDIKVIEFLVLSHLIMPHLSQRRDLEDIHMVNEFAKSVGTPDLLAMLFVLTWADIRAVSHEAWTEWKDHLLQTLYLKAKAIILSERPTEEIVQKRVSEVREAILQRMVGHVDQTQLEKFLAAISPRYVMAHGDDEILRHFHHVSVHDDASLLLVDEEIPATEMSQILIYTLNNPRLIPLTTGVMLSLQINILSMENFFLSDGHVLIKMRVQSYDRQSLKTANLLGALRQSLNTVFAGKADVRKLIGRARRPLFMQKKPVQLAESVVKIDNDVSAYYTVIDVFAHDRLGLLYDIVDCLVTLGCCVEVSKISTKVDQVVDSFYVKDIFGHKITAATKLKEIQQSLLKTVEL